MESSPEQQSCNLDTSNNSSPEHRIHTVVMKTDKSGRSKKVDTESNKNKDGSDSDDSGYESQRNGIEVHLFEED